MSWRVLQRARETVDACDDEGIAGAQKVEFERHLQLGAAHSRRASLAFSARITSHPTNKALPLAPAGKFSCYNVVA